MRPWTLVAVCVMALSSGCGWMKDEGYPSQAPPERFEQLRVAPLDHLGQADSTSPRGWLYMEATDDLGATHAVVVRQNSTWEVVTGTGGSFTEVLASGKVNPQGVLVDLPPDVFDGMKRIRAIDGPTGDLSFYIDGELVVGSPGFGKD